MTSFDDAVLVIHVLPYAYSTYCRSTVSVYFCLNFCPFLSEYSDGNGQNIHEFSVHFRLMNILSSSV
jgi:hypothetical protein